MALCLIFAMLCYMIIMGKDIGSFQTILIFSLFYLLAIAVYYFHLKKKIYVIFEYYPGFK